MVAGAKRYICEYKNGALNAYVPKISSIFRTQIA